MKIVWAIIVVYGQLFLLANAQNIDPFISIANQSDLNTSRTLTNPLQSQVNPSQQEELPAGTVRINVVPVTPEGYYDELSGYQIPSPVSPKFSLINQNTYAAKNSFLGQGETETVTTQVGPDILFPTGTEIQALFTYQDATRSIADFTNMRSDGYGGVFNITQRVWPYQAFTRSQPRLTQNIFGSQTPKVDPKQERHLDGAPASWFVPDYSRNWDLAVGFNFTYSDLGVATLSKKTNTWADTNQNNFGLTPNVVFDLNLRPTIDPDPNAPTGFTWSKLIPNVITIIPSYSEQLMDANNGSSGSAGIFSVADRNTWVIYSESTAPAIAPGHLYPKDLAPTPIQVVQLTESNTIFRDTNQEPLTPPTSSTPLPYQTWARFGIAINYTYRHFNSKVEYDYDAFNAQYQTHTINLSLGYNF